MKMRKLLASVMVAALVIAAVPAVNVDAKATVTNKALPVSFAFKGKTEVAFSPSDESAKAEEYTLDAKIYYPKSAIVDKGSYNIELAVDVYADPGNGEYEPAAIGTTKSTFSVSGEQITFSGSNSSCFSVTAIGDYYLVEIKSLPTKLSQYAGGTYKAYADIPAKVLAFPVFTFDGSATASGKLYVDDMLLKGGSATAYKNSFDTAQKDSATIGDNTVNPTKFAAGSLNCAAKKTVKVGKTAKLGATTEPAGKITYKSSNKKIATVNANGVVKGVKKGKCKITVTANGLKQVVTVTVK